MGMQEKQKQIPTWRRLDNSAKIFPVSTGKRYSTVFRISAVLKETIKPAILEQAVKQALEKFSSFQVKLKQGFFWYYFEENTKEPMVEQEVDYPCQYIDPELNHNYLFKVTYFKKKINMDVNHTLTDGNNATNFFKEILYTYLELKHPKEFVEELRTTRKYAYTIEDSYLKNYDKHAKNNNSSKKAYLLKGNKMPLGSIAAIHEIIDLPALKAKCQEKECTVTQYLTAILIYAIYQENYLPNHGKKPIKVCIPVNLKKYFSSLTLSNFFSYITLEAKMEREHLDSFDKVLQFVKQDFQKRLTEEEILKTMSGNVKLGNNLAIRAIPLFLKKLFVRIGYLEIRKYTTITFSNIGRIGIIGKYQKYIENFLFLIAPEPVESIKCSACSFNDQLVFTFTTILEDSHIESHFYQFLKEQNIPVRIESNGVLDVISEKN
ncbi:MAG: hypothetical protein ACLS95_00675 [Clostridia bacterium]